VIAGLVLAAALSSTLGAKTAKPLAAEKTATAADLACTKDLARGDLPSVRKRCSALKPVDSPEALYWRMVLADDPNDLRKGLSAAALKPFHPDPRLLLLAGRYQFSRGETRELQDLAWLAAKLKLKGPQIDTLKRLTEGK
jgi:hypothetical protein